MGTDHKKTLTREHNVLRKVHRNLIRTQEHIKEVNKFIDTHKPPNRPVHYMHKMFKCTVVPPPPEMSGPISGHGMSKVESLMKLVEKEQEQLLSIRRDASTLAKLIEYHKKLVDEAKSQASQKR